MATGYYGGFWQGLGSYLGGVGSLTTTSATTNYLDRRSFYLQQRQSQGWIDSMEYALAGLNSPNYKMLDEPKKTILEKLRAETKEFIGNRM